MLGWQDSSGLSLALRLIRQLGLLAVTLCLLALCNSLCAVWLILRRRLFFPCDRRGVHLTRRVLVMFSNAPPKIIFTVSSPKLFNPRLCSTHRTFPLALLFVRLPQLGNSGTLHPVLAVYLDTAILLLKLLQMHCNMRFVFIRHSNPFFERLEAS
jgi:hypothetical protein